MTDARHGGQINAQGGSVLVIGRDNTGTINLQDRSHDVAGLPNPYLGLASFTYEARDRYAGREQQVAEALRVLTAAGDEKVVLFVTGASGSGKSSFAQAGLVPKLEEHYRRLGKTPRWAVFRPSRYPLAGLARALLELGLPEPAGAGEPPATIATPEAFNRFVRASTPTDQVNVLIIDQFEELFTQSDPTQRDALFGILAGPASFPELRTHLIATVRADYLTSVFDYSGLFALVKQQSVELRAMTKVELDRAIQRPLQAQNERTGGDKRWQPELVDRLVDDAAEEATFLPLLQVTLEALWTKGKLTLDAYGTLTDALRDKAEAAYSLNSRGEPRPEVERTAVMAIFLDLVRVALDDDARHDARRSVAKADLTYRHPERAVLIDELVTARLLSARVEQDGATQAQMIDIIHETLLTKWERLRTAIQGQREALEQREHFKLALEEWNEHGQSDQYVLGGVRLAEARALAERGDVALLDPDAAKLLARSMARQQRTQRIIVAVALGVLVVVSSAAVVAWFQRRDAVEAQARAEEQSRVAVEQREVALTRQLAAQALTLLDRQLDLALLLSLEANRLTDATEVRGSLLAGLATAPRLSTFLHGHTDRVWSVAFSPDGRTIASAGEDDAIILWDVTTRQSIGRPLTGHTDRVSSVAFSPDGRILASGSTDRTVILWDLATAQPTGPPLGGHDGSVLSVAFSSDGRTLASSGADNAVIVWDVASRRQHGEPLKGHAAGPDNTVGVNSVAFSPDGRRLASGAEDGAVVLWDVTSGQRIGEPLKGHEQGVRSVAFGRDGHTLATGSADYSAMLWDAATGQPTGPPLKGYSGSVLSVAFSPDGSTLATGSGDNSVVLWDVPSRQRRTQPLRGHGSAVRSVAFGPDGRTVASASDDNSVILWDVRVRHHLARTLTGHHGGVDSLAISADGKLLATGSGDKSASLWDAREGQPIGQPLRGHDQRVRAVALSPDGRTLASGSDDTTIILWDAVLRQPRGLPLRGHAREVWSLAFSPDGKTLASGSADYSVILWDAMTGQRRGAALEAHRGWVRGLAFSPDGTTLATGSDDRTIRLWSLATRQPGDPLEGHVGWIRSVAFSPDGKTLASAAQDNTIILRDTASGQVIGRPFTGHAAAVLGVAFSPDGKKLASAGGDGAAILWDVATRQQLGRPLTGHAAGVNGVAFSPDGKTLATGSGDGTVMLWDVDVDSWLARACNIANRNLTPQEWNQYLDGEPYRTTCPSLPAPGV